MLSLYGAIDEDSGVRQEIDPVEDAGFEPPTMVLHAELERAVARALAGLPDTQRAAVELKGLGHSLREIAGILEVSPSNAGVLIHRGRQALTRLLAPFLEYRPDGQAGQRSAE